MIYTVLALSIYSVVVTLMAWGARDSWLYWRQAAKEARERAAEERERGDDWMAKCYSADVDGMRHKDRAEEAERLLALATSFRDGDYVVSLDVSSGDAGWSVLRNLDRKGAVEELNEEGRWDPASHGNGTVFRTAPDAFAALKSARRAEDTKLIGWEEGFNRACAFDWLLDGKSLDAIREHQRERHNYFGTQEEMIAAMCDGPHGRVSCAGRCRPCQIINKRLAPALVTATTPMESTTLKLARSIAGSLVVGDLPDDYVFDWTVKLTAAEVRALQDEIREIK